MNTVKIVIVQRPAGHIVIFTEGRNNITVLNHAMNTG